MTTKHTLNYIILLISKFNATPHSSKHDLRVQIKSRKFHTINNPRHLLSLNTSLLTITLPAVTARQGNAAAFSR